MTVPGEEAEEDCRAGAASHRPGRLAAKAGLFPHRSERVKAGLYKDPEALGSGQEGKGPCAVRGQHWLSLLLWF